MLLIDEFLARYRREYDFYDQSARLLAQQLDVDLQGSGIRAMVTARAKQPGRLEAKVKARAATKEYTSVDAIFSDIVDLAGVRVALYFPAEREEVGKLIRARCDLVDPPKKFPSGAVPSYSKRFSGYWATHYRVRMRDGTLTDTQKRYADARIEIQVASVLMHAWSEVEHDLVYKPVQGNLSLDEFAILDELNGLVMAGEIALERLQRAAEARIAQRGAKFSNHYDLAAYLFEMVKPILATVPSDPALGRVDILFDFLKRISLESPDELEPYIRALDPDVEGRPIAEQIIDRMLAADPSRYSAYSAVRDERDRQRSFESPVEARRSADQHQALGRFLANWIAFERIVREAAEPYTIGMARKAIVPNRRVLQTMEALDAKSLFEVERLRRLRNNLVHGIESPSAQHISEATEMLGDIISELEHSPNQAVRDAAARVLSSTGDSGSFVDV
jgi:ppGpp synthetase/RelA/SpoT-type nucleotidyltranferase